MPWSNTRYIVLAAGDFVLTAIFYYFYRHKRHLWRAIKSATLVTSTTNRDQLARLLYGDTDEKTGRVSMDPVYVAVEGTIEASSPNRKGEQPQVITSEYRPELPLRGVYRLVTMEERHLRRAAGNWYEVTNVVSQDVSHVPACVHVNLGSSSSDPSKSNADKSEGFNVTSIVSPSAWGSAITSSSKYVWNGVMYLPRLAIGGQEGNSSSLDAGTPKISASCVPKTELVFSLPSLAMAEDSIIQDSCLTQVHSDFEEKQRNIMESIGQVVFGNVLIGTIRREKLLLCGSRVYAFANLNPSELTSSSAPSTGYYRLTISTQGGNEVPFIISCLTPEQLASRLKGPVIVLGVLSFIGFGCLCALAAKWWFEKRENRRVADRARQLRDEALNRRRQKLMAAGESPDEAVTDVDSNCVICLDARRDVALLPCGHVCLCSNCYDRLPESKCPLCRAEITGTAPLYFS